MGTQQCFATWELGGTLNAVAVARAPNATTTTQVEPHANETGTEGKVMFVAAEDGHLHAFDLRSRAAVRLITPSQRFVHTKLTEYTDLQVRCRRPRELREGDRSLGQRRHGRRSDAHLGHARTKRSAPYAQADRGASDSAGVGGRGLWLGSGRRRPVLEVEGGGGSDNLSLWA